MLKNKVNLFLIFIAVVAMIVLFSKHSPAESADITKIQSATPEKPMMIEAVIKKIDKTNKIITIAKTKNNREKIIYRTDTPFLIISTTKTKQAKISDLKVNDKIIIFLGLHPTRSEFYLAGLFIQVDSKSITPTVKVTQAKTAVAKKAAVIKPATTTKPVAKATVKAPAPKPSVAPVVNTPKPTTMTPPSPAPAVVAPPATPPLTYSSCSPLPAPTGNIVTASNWKELKTAITNANQNNGNVTILLNDGEYAAEHFLFIYASNVTVRGKSGDRNKVIIKSPKMKGGASHIFGVIGDNVTIADMSIGNVANHVIQVFGEKDADNLLVHNVHLFDAGEQLLKVSTDNKHKEVRPENSIIECSLFEYTAGTGPQFYIGGIDAHNAVNWIVRDNTFKNIRSPESKVAEHAIHFWNDSEGTLVERNTIINCDRGIGFGLGTSKHSGGIIRNNIIYHNSTKGDVGIGLESASNAKVYNNTIFVENDYWTAIEYRWAGTTGVEIFNNLINKPIMKRDNGSANLQNNFTNATAEMFIDTSTGNLRLKQNIAGVVDAGITINSVNSDIDKQSRPQGNAYDIGADEWRP